jgi:acyl-CoA dehydrogenase
VAAVTGPYSMVREQFGIPIGRMEGVEEKVGRIAAISYMLEGARVFGCSAVDAGHQPPVVSAILKAYSTELARELVTDGMDVFSGAGVMQGPNNILGRGYSAAPVGITVEGANIMTRTLMIFGQGATRCHPYALKVVHAVSANDVAAFRANLLGWIGHFIANLGRLSVRSLTRGASAGSPVSGPTARYYRCLAWASTRFAVLTDLAMFSLGGKLKVRGKLTGRYADVLAWMVLATAALRRFEAEGRLKEDLPLVEYAVNYALMRAQEAFEGIYRNFGGLVGAYLRSVGLFFLRLNPLASAPRDALSHQAALAIQSLSPQYQRLTHNVFMPPEETPGIGRLLKAFRLLNEAAPVVAKIRSAQRDKRLPHGAIDAVLPQALQLQLINADDAGRLRDAAAARAEAIEVDVFTPEQFFPAQVREAPRPAAEPLRRAARA